MSTGTTRWCNSRLGKKSFYINTIKTIQKLQVPDQDGIYLRKRGDQLDVRVDVQELDSQCKIRGRALLDSGCTGSAIDRRFVEAHQMKTILLEQPLRVRNADGTENKGGNITEIVQLRIRIGERH